jgi:inorganic pyrophosphatase
MKVAVRVFIENEAGSNDKNTFDERTLAFLRRERVSRSYPYPYGFVLGTRGGDGDAVDCFVLTATPLRSGAIVDCEPLGLLEQIEDGEIDHKVLAALEGDEVRLDDAIVAAITDFIAGVFAHVPGKRVSLGRLLPRAEAEAYLHQCREPTG